ncbi:alpha/beta fold hydrolase [Thioclava sp. FR2]|uniref:alpha/beta fold hydrolase n=1 Tax=Thioclava sp. FR2 TaxID=3445780 RepID=UPI003EB9B5A2
MSDSAISLRDIRSFHVGGATVELVGQPRQEVRVSPDAAPRTVDMNGHYVSGQLYAQHFMLEQPRSDVPILFWHGGAMTGVTWETTPDDRPGWSQFFLRQGHDVVVSDAVERGRASWSPYPQIYDSAPLFRTAEDAWYLFRMGEAEDFADRRPFSGQRFPIRRFDQLCAQFVPRWTTNAETTIAAYMQLVARFDRVIVIAHSQGGWFAQSLAARMPERIAAVVLLEPAGAPNLDKEGLARSARVPHFYVWGDNCDSHKAWKPYKSDAIAHSDSLRDLGGQVETLDLPKQGIYGNSHMPMMDDNSDEIASMVATWLRRNMN